MSRSFIIYISLLLLSLAGCRDGEKLQPVLWQSHARHLLSVGIQDSLYHPLTPYAGQIYDAMLYFDSINDKSNMLVRSHYYRGRISQDMENDRMAVEEMNKAILCARQISDGAWIDRIISNLEFMMWVKTLKLDSVLMQNIPMEVSPSSGGKTPLDIVEMGFVYLQEKQDCLTAAERYFKHALYLNKTSDDLYIDHLAAIGLCTVYLRLKRPQSVFFYARQGLAMFRNSARTWVYRLKMGQAYCQRQQYDSASLYLKQSLASHNYYLRKEAYRCLANIALSEGHSKEVALYRTKYQEYEDSIQNTFISSSVLSSVGSIEWQNKQDLHHYRSFMMRYPYYTLALLLVLIFSFLVFYVRLRRKKNLMLQYQRQIDANKDELLSLQKKQLAQKDIQVLQLKKMNIRELLSSTSVYKRICVIGQRNEVSEDKMELTDIEWHDLEQAFDLAIPHFVDTLTTDYPQLTSKDLRFCMLYLLDFSISDIRFIMRLSLQAVYKRKTSVMQHLGLLHIEDLKNLLQRND